MILFNSHQISINESKSSICWDIWSFMHKSAAGRSEGGEGGKKLFMQILSEKYFIHF